MIGYCCITVGVPGLVLRTCSAKAASEEKLRELIAHNLRVLERTMHYCHEKGVGAFRISSDLIPFGSSPVNTLDWAAEFAEQLARIGATARRFGIRLSMHPGQYTVLNSPDEGVVQRAVEDLQYHTRLLAALGCNSTCKIVLHIGGVYGDKAAAAERFCTRYRGLPAAIRSHLVVENDDKLYTAEDVLAIAQAVGVPMVFDNLHHEINPSAERSEAEWILAARKTWGPADGPQKVHYSQQAPGRKAGSHSDTISIEPFLEYHRCNAREDLTIMLEVKDKNLSAIKCVNATDPGARITRLEEEWALYKYLVLAHAPDCYQQIRALLKDKNTYPAVAFYSLVEQALAREVRPGDAVNAAQHAWGYFKHRASAAQAKAFHNALAAYAAGSAGAGRYMGMLRRLAGQYDVPYLANSYYLTL